MSETCKLAVTGSRHWEDRETLWRALDDVRPRPSVLIHGGAVGADNLAALWAREHDLPTAVVRPARSFEKAEYLRRNDVIVSLADYVIAFRAEGKSNGTDYTIRAAGRAGKLLRVVAPTDAKSEQLAQPLTDVQGRESLEKD